VAGQAGANNPDRPSIRVIGRVRIAVLERDEAIARILASFRSGEPLLVGFCNAHTVNLAASDRQFAASLGSFLMLNDGVGVDLASRILYEEPFPSNLVGTDLVPELLGAAEPGLRLFLIGSADGVAARAGKALCRQFPAHAIVGTHHGFLSSDEQEKLALAVRAARPDLILVGMGQPRQELWSLEHLADVPAVTMCVGAFLEFAAGTIPRAPRWLRTARLEWLYRLALEPRRLARRYLVGNVEFMLRVFRQRAS
jgi:alpha-1,3-mannosyltransferase